MRRAPLLWMLPILWAAGGAVAAPGDRKGDAPLPPVAANLSVHDTQIRSREYMTRMEAALALVTRLQAEAQKRKDVIKLNCVNDKLTQIRGYRIVGERSFNNLNAFIEKKDEGVRQHEFTRLGIVYQKIESLKAEAQTCIGEDIPVFGVDRVTIEEPKGLGDAADPRLPDIEAPRRPPEASPAT